MKNKPELYNYCHVVGRTDTGCKRAANEDNMDNFVSVNGLASVVCDGMGGHVGGATASRIAVGTIREFLDGRFYDDPRDAIGEAIDAANRAILQHAAARPELQGMGSTCVLLLVRNAKVYIGYVGDSRVYLIRNKRIKQLTTDHSYVQMLVDAGDLTPEEAERHPRKNEITNALGIPDMKPATVLEDAILPEAGDCFLLCSDGLSGMVSDKEIERIVSRQAEMGSQERADLLVERAKEHGGLDNITVQLVEFSITPGQASVSGKNKRRIGIALAFVLLCAGGSSYYFMSDCSRQKNPGDEGDRVHPSDSKSEIVSRTDSMLVLPPAEFKANTKLLEIRYAPDSTRIFMAGISVRSLPAVPGDSLRYEGGDISVSREETASGNHVFLFKEIFLSDTLYFSIADSAWIYRLAVPVTQPAPAQPVPIRKDPPRIPAGGEEPSEGKTRTEPKNRADRSPKNGSEARPEEKAGSPKKSNSENGPEEKAGNDAVEKSDTVTPPAEAGDTLSVNAGFEFVAAGNLLSVTRRREEAFLSVQGKQTKIPASFVIRSLDYDKNYFTEEIHDDGKKLYVSFTQTAPPDDTTIEVEGRVTSADGTPRPYILMIRLHKIQRL